MFTLLFYFIPLVLCLIFSVVVFTLGNKKLLKLVGYMWVGIACLVLSAITYHYLTTKKRLKSNDIYGEYIIYRIKSSGKQADGQYNHFRFEITKENKFIFLETEKDHILKSTQLDFNFLEAYSQPRINIHFDTTRHHIIAGNPTLYRTIWSFYYVFHSAKFGNVFFTKGKWKPID